ncbi:hypothetical protein NJC38_22240 [Pseudomonas sp. 21LCFQ010]|uniref:hypothetical protein n=1 Tax=Pseudomonas sp. 21LCFQ010 TaxID=2957506 RepID=UPI0020981B79|nr:hypothetical protein [Pseudomonas sp. 21LCFQ010]MCO8164862.1 hypothetical protein [Pseudomonas sp. 21LCFQ010]
MNMPGRCKIIPTDIDCQFSRLALIDHQNAPYLSLPAVASALGLVWCDAYISAALRPCVSNLLTDDTSAEPCLPLAQFGQWLEHLKPACKHRTTRAHFKRLRTEAIPRLWSTWGEYAETRRSSYDMHLSYAGSSFRFKQIGATKWYVAIDVARALDFRNTRSMLGLLNTRSRLTLRFGKRDYQAINSADILRLCLIAPAKNATALSAWLSDLDSQINEPGLTVYVREECRELVQNYVSRCRRSLVEAQAKPVEFDVSMANQIADKVASAVIQHRRWLLNLSGDGTPVLTPVPSDSMVFNLDHLLRWIRDRDGASDAQVMQISAAVMGRNAGGF